MDPVELFKMKGKRWSDQDDSNMIEMYNNTNSNIVDIAKKLSRTVGSIIARLKQHNLVPGYAQTEEEYLEYVNGYQAYLDDTRYRRLESEFQIQAKHKTLLKKENATSKENTNDTDSLKNEIKELRNELRELSNYIKTYMNK